MIKVTLSRGFPVVLSVFFAIFVETCNLVFVGNYGSAAQVAGIGLGNSFINLVCVSAIIGNNSVMAALI